MPVEDVAGQTLISSPVTIGSRILRQAANAPRRPHAIDALNGGSYDPNRNSVVDAPLKQLPGQGASRVVGGSLWASGTGGGMKRHSRSCRRWLATGAVTVIATVIVAACDSGGSTGSQGSGADGSAGGSRGLTFGSFSTFTGPNAPLGPEQIAGCYTAVVVINEAGGILGHKVRCQAIDDRGDPADGVAAATKALATIGSFVGTLGPGLQATDEAPVLEKAGIVMFADTGDSAFNHTTDRYFWRITPSDSAAGYAMALWAKHLGYTRGAAVFATAATAQTSFPTLLAGFRKLGGNMAVTDQLVPTALSYQSEVTQVLDAHPQVIFTEADPQTDATFFKELMQRNHGKVIPIIGTETTYTSQWQSAVGAAIGTTNLAADYVALQPYAPLTGPAYAVFENALLGDGSQIPNPGQWEIDLNSMTDYDGVTIMALAMLKAHSTSPSVYDSSVMAVTEPGADKTVVYSFAQGKQALAAGHSIQYVGASGDVVFNRWHNNTEPFSAVGYSSSGGSMVAGIVSASELAELAG